MRAPYAEDPGSATRSAHEGVGCRGPSYAQILKSSSIIAVPKGSRCSSACCARRRRQCARAGGMGSRRLYSSVIALVTSLTGLGIAAARCARSRRRWQAPIAAAGRTLRACDGPAGSAVAWTRHVRRARPAAQRLGIRGCERAPSIAVLGVTLLMSSVVAGEVALVQGRDASRTWRATDLDGGDRTAIAILVYSLLRERGSCLCWCSPRR